MIITVDRLTEIKDNYPYEGSFMNRQDVTTKLICSNMTQRFFEAALSSNWTKEQLIWCWTLSMKDWFSSKWERRIYERSVNQTDIDNINKKLVKNGFILFDIDIGHLRHSCVVVRTEQGIKTIDSYKDQRDITIHNFDIVEHMKDLETHDVIRKWNRLFNCHQSYFGNVSELRFTYSFMSKQEKDHTYLNDELIQIG
jgi:hypothetical protein